jgi:hypothetical protein
LRRAAVLVEVALGLALAAALVIAGIRFFALLARLGIAWPKGLPVALLFGVAAVFAVRRSVRRWRASRTDGDHGRFRIDT